MACVTLLVSHVAADVIKLRSGGEVDGILLNPDEEPRTKYVMQLESGGKITVAKEDVRIFLPLSEAQKDYRGILEKMKTRPPTAELNWKVAKWCKENGLRNQRKLHLEAAIQLDPDHEQARLALGYSLRNGVWKRSEDYQRERKELMLSRGYELHEGDWRLPQDVLLEKKRTEDDRAAKRWVKDLRQWRGWLGKRRGEEALAAIKAIDDPRAAGALAEALENEGDFRVAILYVRALAKMRSGAGTRVLTKVVLATPRFPTGPQLDLRDEALDSLDKGDRDQAVEAFIHSLSDNDNVVVKNAAIGLQRLVESRSTRPLIDALVTTHKSKAGQDNPGQLSTSFGGGANGGGIGFGAGSRAKVVEEQVRNREALDALLLLSGGVNFEYNKAKWREWLALRDTPRPDHVDLRRGP